MKLFGRLLVHSPVLQTRWAWVCRSVLHISQPGWYSWSTKVNGLSHNEQGQMLIISLIQ